MKLLIHMHRNKLIRTGSSLMGRSFAYVEWLNDVSAYAKKIENDQLISACNRAHEYISSPMSCEQYRIEIVDILKTVSEK